MEKWNRLIKTFLRGQSDCDAQCARIYPTLDGYPIDSLLSMGYPRISIKNKRKTFYLVSNYTSLKIFTILGCTIKTTSYQQGNIIKIYLLK